MSKEKMHNMANCMLSILDSLKLYDSDNLFFGDETLSEIMFRKMKAYKKIIIAISVLITLGVAGIAIAAYTVYNEKNKKNQDIHPVIRPILHLCNNSWSD